MNSSSERLLEIIRKLEYDGLTNEGYGFKLGDGTTTHSDSSYQIAVELGGVNENLSNNWYEVDNFFGKIIGALEEKLRVVRSELEIYSQSSISNEEELVTVVREVSDKANDILKRLAII